jgi:bifunctional non-homologous end joining protein LigD
VAARDSLACLGRPQAGGRVTVELEGRRVRLSNLDKLMFPAAGWTKAHVIDYYLRVASALLPHVAGRPLTLRRYPDGVGGPSRFEKCCPDHRPPWLRVARVWSTGRAEDLPFCLIDDLPSLVWSANLANLELHPMLARAEAVQRPTVVAFDLDPGPPAGLLETARVALLVRTALAGVGLRAWVKTSGGKGLQVMAPLNREDRYPQTKAFARTVAEVLAREVPDLVVARVARSQRAGRVLVDWGQNDRHKSIVAPYSLRAREQPAVSTPVTWDEVEAVVAARDPQRLRFTPEAVLQRLDQYGDLFAPVLTERQTLPA